jgi:6-phospho-beta-glucosidase
MNRRSLKHMIKKTNFLWGSASAAYQIEGAYESDEKGLSIWDEWTRLPGKTYKGTNGNVAADHYHRFEEDIALMKEQGLKAYRFSIAWTRILPNGTGEMNFKGIQFYKRLIQMLKDAAIEPVITLYHWDLPQVLQDAYEGWEGRQIVDDFDAYARVCFENFGEEVKYWIIMNEPNIFTGQGYMLALHPPGKTDESAYLKTYHHTALAHAKAVLSYKSMGYQGLVGSSIAFSPAYSASESAEDLKALDNYYATTNWWFMDSYFKGAYPEEGIRYFTQKGVMPEVTEEDLILLKAGAEATDFIGINYYQTAMIAHNPVNGVGFQGMNTTGEKGSQKESGVPGLYKMVQNPNVTYTDWDWAIDPDGLRYGMVELTERYHLPIFISENGLGAFDTINEDGSIDDDYRINFLEAHVKACEMAVDEGVDLIGYCTWSFTDLLSWLNGFQKRYGFVYIDFENEALTRIPKKSYYWYKKLIENNGI